MDLDDSCPFCFSKTCPGNCPESEEPEEPVEDDDEETEIQEHKD